MPRGRRATGACVKDVIMRSSGPAAFIRVTGPALAMSVALVASTPGIAAAEAVTAFPAGPAEHAPGAPAGGSVKAPTQRGGSAAGRPHLVSTAETRAKAGSERRSPGTARGQLPAATVSRADEAPGRSGHGVAAEVLEGTQQPKFDARTSKELPAQRDASSKVFANVDGTFTRRLYAGPVHYRDDGGQWKPIDTTVKSSGGRLAQTANEDVVSFAPKASDPQLVSFTLDESHSIAFGIEGAAAAVGEPDGSGVAYRSVRAGADVEFDSSAQGVKEVLVLRSAAAPREWVFPLEYSGVVPSLEANGAVLLRDSGGEVLATIPPGFMEDSKVDDKSGLAARSDGVRYELIPQGSKTALKVTLDDAWLDSPERVYPVRVDPTIAIDATGDTFVSKSYPGNHGQEDLLQAGTYNGGTDFSTSYLQFPAVSTVLAGQHILGAGLGLYNVHSWNCTAKPVSVHEVTGTWSENTLEWPGASYVLSQLAAKSFAHGPAGCGPAWEVIDLGVAGADLVERWAAGGTNRGITVRASATDSGGWKKFASKDSANRPYLDVAYAANVAPQVTGQFPPNGFVEGTLTPQLYAAGYDPDAWPLPAVDFKFKVCGGTVAAPVGCAESGWIDAPTWVVPSGTLKWGQKYFYQVWIGDGRTSDAGSTNFFTTATPQPLITSHLAQNPGRGFDAQIGNYTTEATDAVVQTVGPDLSVRRTYNSLDPRTGNAFGEGWSTTVST